MKNDDNEPIDLHAEREKREHTTLHQAHEQGEAFAFPEYVFNDDGVGILEEDNTVCVVIDPRTLKGFRVSVEGAEKLGVALIQAAASVRITLAQHEADEEQP
jgi:hypothetical protein